MNTKTKAVIAYIIIFLAGLSAGFVLNENLPSNNREYRSGLLNNGEGYGNQVHGNEQHWSETMPERANIRLTRHLNLNEDQREDFFDRMNSYKAKISNDIQDFRRDERNYIREQYSNFRAEVSAILSTEQLEKLDRVAHPDSVRQSRMRRQRGMGPGNR